MYKKICFAAACILALVMSVSPASACSSHGLIASGDGPGGTGDLSFPVPITLTVQTDDRDPGSGVATVSAFQVAATPTHTCAVAIAVSPKLVVESLAFVDADGNHLRFSPFELNKELTRTFHEGGGEPSFRVFTASVLDTVSATPAKLEIWFRTRPRGLSAASMVDLFSRSRIATGRVEGHSGFIHHLAIVRPAAVIACLGLPGRDGLSTCPAHDHAH